MDDSHRDVLVENVAVTVVGGASNRGRKAWTPFLLVLIGLTVRIPQLWHPLTGSHSFRQTQTAFAVSEFARHGVDLLNVPLPIFGTQRSVPFEFPIFQAAAAEIVRLGVPVIPASRGLALAMFEAAAVVMYLLLRRWHGQASAVVALGLYQVLPFGLLWGAAVLVDFSSVTFGLLMVLLLDTFVRTGSRLACGVALLSAWLMVLVKVTSAPTAGIWLLTGVCLALLDHRWKAVRRRALVAVLAVPASALLPLVLWTRHADNVKAQSPLTDWLTSQHLQTWNFGTVAQRLDPATYELVLERFTGEVTGLFGLGIVFALAGIVLGRPRERILLVGLLLAVLGSPLVFWNLFVVHSYYLIAVYPAAVSLVGVGAATCAQRLTVAGWARRAMVTLLALLVVTGAWATPRGAADVREYLASPPVPRLALELRRLTSPHDQIVLVDCGWSPWVLFNADRTGLMIRPEARADAWTDNNPGRFAYLASCLPGALPVGYLPSGYGLEATDAEEVWRIVRKPST
ncbi:hypothetical protein [Nocardioides mesophilus]|uniref:Glycosyltransferase family 39 protein n=1 Tax=Nocardioides mesophilus TaxID=433659 RepID=A0A7G9RBZ9_9ACTN|nr:hypothetical protein [Nocardioides mesophilus]QNN53124.1 hypothetical protein H9L09_01080 [Nocardioides mesophilus]